MIISELFETLVPVIRNLYARRYKENCQELLKELAEIKMVSSYEKPNRGKFIRSYIDGFLSGLSERLQQDKKIFLTDKTEEKMYQLIVVKKTDLIKDFIKENIGTLQSTSTKSKDINVNAFMMGQQDGKTKNTNRQLH